jgi:LEA14-like dessication related protein
MLNRFGAKALIVAVLLALSGCATVKTILHPQKPEVKVHDVKIEKISFSEAELLFDLAVKNPNNIAFTLNSIAYDVHIENKPFISGTQEEELKIAARGETLVPVPVTFVYRNLYDTVLSLRGKEDAAYELSFVFSFDVPALGSVTVPVTRKGEVPLLVLPTIKLRSLRLTYLGFSSADLMLEIAFDNPNPISVDVNRLEYQLSLNGSEWLSGHSIAPMHIAEESQGLISIPVTIDLRTAVKSLTSLLQQGYDVQYAFRGSMSLTTSIPLMGELQLPFDVKGRIDIDLTRKNDLDQVLTRGPGRVLTPECSSES